MRSKVPSKLDLLLAVATIAALMGFIERGHSIVIDPPDQVALKIPATSCVAADRTYTDAAATMLPEDLLVSGLLGASELPPERSACDPN